MAYRVKESRLTFAETIARLSSAITNAGNTIFATIDQAAAAASVGMSLRPTTLIIFGNPKAGTGLMDEFPLLALELPLKLLVWDEGASVKVAYVPMSDIVNRYDVIGKEAQVAVMDRALDALTSQVA